MNGMMMVLLDKFFPLCFRHFTRGFVLNLGKRQKKKKCYNPWLLKMHLVFKHWLMAVSSERQIELTLVALFGGCMIGCLFVTMRDWLCT